MKHRTSLKIGGAAVVTALLLMVGINVYKNSTAQVSTQGTTAIPVEDFLNSIGVNTTWPNRGQPVEETIKMLKYTGIRWVRGGIEQLSEGTTWQPNVGTYLEVHKQTGVKFSWGLLSTSTDITKLIRTAKKIHASGALLAFEGNNEPNNWGVTYEGIKGGGSLSWLPVGKVQRDLYAAVKNDPVLKNYPVWSISENGGQTDNVGLQFLAIPPTATGTLLPPGTKFADAANVHNYIYHANAPGLADNKTWNASDPTSASKIDGLFKNYGRTWLKKFNGYSDSQIVSIPRVTTETGLKIEGAITERIQGLNILSLYLDQFKRGFSHTAVYLLSDRTDELGNQTYGMFKPDYYPRQAAWFLHNMTTILADTGRITQPGKLNYVIDNQPATVHDMLLQRSDGTFMLIVWGERLTGADDITIRFPDGNVWARLFDPTLGEKAYYAQQKTRSLRLQMTDHPIIISVQPRY